jgi:hypothetical protein
VKLEREAGFEPVDAESETPDLNTAACAPALTKRRNSAPAPYSRFSGATVIEWCSRDPGFQLRASIVAVVVASGESVLVWKHRMVPLRLPDRSDPAL